MTLYQLIFILLFFGSVVGLLASLMLRLARRGVGSRRLLLALASMWTVYLSVLVITDIFARQKIYKAGEEECFDEMCFAVDGTQRMESPYGSGASTYVVTVRMTNRGRGRAQAEGGLRGRLYESRLYLGPSASAQQAYEVVHGTSPKLTQKLAAGESVESVLVFAAPHGMTRPALALDHGFTPGYFVIGESPFFHEPTVHVLT